MEKKLSTTISPLLLECKIFTTLKQQNCVHIFMDTGKLSKNKRVAIRYFLIVRDIYLCNYKRFISYYLCISFLIF